MKKIKNFLKRLFWIFATYFLALLPSSFAYEGYFPSQCEAPRKLSHKTLVQVDPSYYPTHFRYQGVHDTCSGFTAQFLTQFILNKSRHLSHEHFLVPSVVDLIIRNKRSNLSDPNLGHTAVLLQKLKNSSYDVCLDFFDKKGRGDYERFFGENYDQFLNALAKDNSKGEFIKWVEELNPESPHRALHGDRPLEPLLKNIYLAGDQAYYLTSCNEKAKLPLFNIVLNQLGKDKKRLKLEEFNHLFRSKLIEMLKKDYPVALGTGIHTVAITGIRQTCCDDDCHEEWQVYDSRPSSLEEDKELDHWYFSYNFSGASDATQILPCVGVECSSRVIGPPTRDFSIISDDLEGLQHAIGGAKVKPAEALTMIERALKYGALRIPRWLIETQGVSVNAILADGSPLLHHATHYKVLDFVIFLLRKKADLNQNSHEGKPVLFEMIDTKMPEMVNVYLKRGGSKAVHDRAGEGPLFYCLRTRNHKMLNHLLGLKFDPNEINASKQRVYDYAKKLGEKSAAAAIKAAGGME